MLKIYLSLFFLFLFSITKAQVKLIRKSVFDVETKSIVPYATIHLIKSNKYIDADAGGYFEIEISNPADSLIISSIGYKTLKIGLSEIDLIDSVFLDKQKVTLKELVLAKPTIKTFGILDEKKGTSSSGGSIVSRLEMTTLIEIPAEIEFYRLSKIFIKGWNFREENPVKLHIYDVDSNGLPGNELLTKQIIISNNESSNKTVSIDVRNQQIFLERTDFFVGIQWMTSTKVKSFTGPEIFETVITKKLLTYRRQVNVNKNKWFGLFKTNGGKRSMVFYPGGTPLPGDIPMNMLASAEIEIFPQ